MKNHGGFDIFLDARNYFGVGGKAVSYTDNFLEITHPVGKKFFVGVDVVYDHWWEGQHDWFLAGPLVGYKLTKEMSIFARISHEWDMNSGQTKEVNVFRLGVTYNF